MKRPEYVAIVTGVYARAIRERREPTPQELQQLEQAFSRQGFTQGYYLNNKGAHMFGVHQDTPEDKELLAALHAKLLEIDPDGRRICELLMEGKTERDIASVMGFASQSSVSHRKRKAFDQLRTLLHEYI